MISHSSETWKYAANIVLVYVNRIDALSLLSSRMLDWGSNYCQHKCERAKSDQGNVHLFKPVIVIER